MTSRRPRTPRIRLSPPGFAERLIQVLDSFPSTYSAGHAIHRSDGAIRKWRRGESAPTAPDLWGLCEASGYSAEWLLFGTDLQGRSEREHRVLVDTVRLVDP